MARGRVEFSSDFFLLKPKQVERGNGTVLSRVTWTRSSKGMLGFYGKTGSGGLNPTTEAHLGDGFLMTQGFTHLGRLAVRSAAPRRYRPAYCAPIATDNGKPITGIVQSEVIVAQRHTRIRRSPIAITSPTQFLDPNDPANPLTIHTQSKGRTSSSRRANGNWTAATESI